MAIKYRMNTADDQAALVQLWSEQGGFDDIDARTWAHRMMHTPRGNAAIVVAEDGESGEILGQFPFIPSTVSVDGREVSAYRPFAPIMKKNLRFQSVNPLNQPVFAMYRHAVNVLRQRGEGLIYMVPDRRWLRGFRMFPMFNYASFPLWSRPLPLSAPLQLGSDFIVREVEPQGVELDRLWQKAARVHGCLVVRDSRILPWKLSHSSYTVLGVERGGELVGIVASLHKKRDKQWLICDMLTADTGDSLHATIAAVVNHAHEQSLVTNDPMNKVAVLATPLMQPVLKDLQFFRDEYDFPIVVHVLDPNIAKEAVDPSRWYVSAND